MKRHTIIAAIAAAITLFTACTYGDDMPETGDSYTTIRISVSEMNMEPASSRAIQPMGPDEENYFKTLAIFEFDNEGIHDKHTGTSYHFIDFINGYIDGVSNPEIKSETGVIETTTKEELKLQFEYGSNYDKKGTLCFVANVTEDQVEEFYQKCMKDNDSGGELGYGRVMLSYFKTWALPFEYEDMQEGIYDETDAGHLKNMYMFGYYEGEIKRNSEIPIDLGRLASRVDIAVKNETGADITKCLGYHFDSICNSAYFFPIKMGMPPSVIGTTRTVICKGEDKVGSLHLNLGNEVTTVPDIFTAGATHTRYFYTAAHSAKDESEASKLHLFWNSDILASDKVQPGGTDIKIPLCNVHPDLAHGVTNGYSLSRNTRYRFTIRLKKGNIKPATGTTPGTTPSQPPSRVIPDPANPYDITVYLP